MSKKKTTKKAAPKRRAPWAILLVAALLVAVVIGIVLLRDRQEGPGNSTTGPQNVATGNFNPAGTKPTIKIDQMQDIESEIYKGLQVTKIGSYTGLFVEDGSDEVLSRILMVIVKNTGTKTVQYAEIELTDGNTTACFSLTTLPPGESVVLLEKNRMLYADGKDLSEITFRNVAVFPQEPSLCEDRIQIQALDGVLNVTNISGQDIEGDVVIYYKNASSDLLYGGITYRVTIKGGIKAGEVKQLQASHYAAKGSRVMWVTVG